MGVNATVTLCSQQAANSNSMTYVSNNTFRCNNSNMLVGSTYRLVIAGWHQPAVVGSEVNYPTGLIYNVLLGANGNLTDNVIFSTTEGNYQNQFFREFYVTARDGNVISGNVSVVSSIPRFSVPGAPIFESGNLISGVADSSLVPLGVLTLNANVAGMNTTANGILGIAIQTVGKGCFSYVEYSSCEQLI